MTAGTAVGIAATVAIGIARSAIGEATIAFGIARIAIGEATVTIGIAGTIIGGAAVIQTETVEQVSERSESWCCATVVGLARIAVDNVSARVAVGEATIAIGVAGRAILTGEQVTQASAQIDTGNAANVVARSVDDDVIARIASNNWFAGIAVVGADAVDQSLESRKQVSCSRNLPVASTAWINASRVAGTRKTLNTQQ